MSQRTQNCPPGGSNSSSTQTCSLSIKGFPLVGFSVQSAIPCYLQNGYGWSGRGNEYSNMESTFLANIGGNGLSYTRGYILQQEDSGCSQQFDSRWVGVYGASEMDIYMPYAQSGYTTVPDNKIPLTFVTSNPGNRWYLAYQHEVDWQDAIVASASAGCSVSREKVVDNNVDVDRLRSAQLALIALTILAFIFVGVIGCCITINVIQKDNDGKIEKGEPGYNQMCALKILNYLFKIGTYSCVIASVVLAFGLVGIFSEITKVGTDGVACTDVLSLSSFQGLAGIIDGLSKKNMIQGFTNFVDFLAEIFHQVIHCVM